MERDDIEKAENKPALIEYTHRDGSCGYLVVPNPQEVKEAIDRWASTVSCPRSSLSEWAVLLLFQPG